MRGSRRGRALLVPVFALALAACAPTPAALPADAVPDYQLGGAYPPADAVTIVTRDSTAQPDPERYSICYVNGFQTQPGEEWPDELLVQGPDGPIVDPDWPDEHILEVSTPEQRDAVVARSTAAIEHCAAAGFDAVEFDNLDSYTRSGGAFGLDETVDAATRMVDAAHAAGLAAGQKNTPELGTRGRDEVGFNFAVVEECDRYEECSAYTSVYGAAVIAIEYADELRRPFAEVCADPATPSAVVLRDRGLSTPADPGYVFELC